MAADKEKRSPLSQMKDTNATERRVAVSNNVVQIVPPNAERVAIVISAHPSSSIQLYFTPGNSNLQGMLIPAGVTPLTLTLEQHGGLVKRGLDAFSAGSFNLVVWEVFACPCLM